MKVSVIIPIYNVSPYLADCLESCIHQTFTDLEIICVNDGSPDGSLAIIEKYKQKDSRIVCVNKQNAGLPLARKSGIEAATGDYIFHLDGDDDLPLDAIASLVAVAESSWADMVIGDFYWVEDNRKTVINSEISTVLSSSSYLQYILERGWFNIWGKLIKRSLYTRHPIEFPAHIVMAEDLVACFQLARFAQTIVASHTPCCNHYIRESSMSREKKKAVGELADRSIHAVCYITHYYEINGMDSGLHPSLEQFLANFLYLYLRSPYAIRLHEERLRYLNSRITISYIHTVNNRLKRTALWLAKVNLNWSKSMMRMIMFILRLKQ